LKSSTKHAWALIAAATLFSTAGAAIKSCALTGVQVASLRAGFAGVAILLLMPEARGPWTWPAAAVSLAYAASMTLFVVSTKLTTSANAIFLQATSPLYILLLGPWLLKEPARRGDLTFLAALGVGLGLFFVGVDAPAVTAPDPLRGNTLAAFSGLTIGLLFVGLRWLSRRNGGEAAVAVFLGNVIGLLTLLPAALPLSHVRPVDWLLLAYLGFFQIGLAYSLVTRALGHVRALQASMLLLIEPVLNPVWAWLVHGEKPGAWSRLGGGIILGATALKIWLDARRD
jgi:drug/metabolite transporter (DMT)-like permease